MLLEKRVVEKGMGEVWVVSRHSAPAFVGVAEVARRCLPMGELEGFVREVRRRLVAWRRRVDAVEGVWGGGREVECDDEVAEVVVRWGDREARCRVGERAVVERAVVMVGKGGRAPEVERKLVGDLAGLPERMGWGVAE